MNLFQKYGIKEIADVTLFSITQIGDEEFYTPVLHFDTLKISTLGSKTNNVTQYGGYGNQKLMSWNYGREISVAMEDALFSPASMSLTYNWLNSKLSKYTSLIAKMNVANKYGKLNYSTYAIPSPKITDEEWETLFRCLNTDEEHYSIEFVNEAEVAERRHDIKNQYYKRLNQFAIKEEYIQKVFNKLKYIEQLGSLESGHYELETIDRFERCVVEKEEGLVINAKKQFENLKKYYADVKDQSYTIFYDIKTMQPFFEEDENKRHPIVQEGEFTLKKGTVYYKWSRTVKPAIDDSGLIGKTLTIDAETFPGHFKIVGETYIRQQKTNKDERFQFVINKAQISSNTNISLTADGSPTTFSFSVDALVPENGIIAELRQYDVVDDEAEGGTKILPRSDKNSHTKIFFKEKDFGIEEQDNDEIY